MAHARATVSSAPLLMAGDVFSEPRRGNAELIFEDIS
jgi:hypothetical protein